MNVFVNLKTAGRRRPVLYKAPYAVPDGVSTLRRLIEAIVKQEVEKYNARGTDNLLVQFLAENEIAALGDSGKIGFGRLYNDKKANPEKAAETALLGFADGLFRVAVDGEEAEDLDSALKLREGSVLTFIRLTFLAGRTY